MNDSIELGMAYHPNSPVVEENSSHELHQLIDSNNLNTGSQTFFQYIVSFFKFLTTQSDDVAETDARNFLKIVGKIILGIAVTVLSILLCYGAGEIISKYDLVSHIDTVLDKIISGFFLLFLSAYAVAIIVALLWGIRRTFQSIYVIYTGHKNSYFLPMPVNESLDIMVLP
jgi:cytochrome bd-type quinol oxidase subunit 2